MKESGPSAQPNGAAGSPLDAGLEINAGLRSVVAQGGRLLVRNPGALFSPVIVISVLLWSPCLAVVLMALDGQALIRNGAVEPVAPRPGLVITSSAVILALMSAHLVLVAMVAVMTVDALLDRPVSAGRALRAALRCSGRLLMPLALAGVAASALILLVAFTPPAGRSWMFVAPALTLVAVVACWLLLAVPIVVLYESGPFLALGRLWQITRRRRTMMSWHAMVTAIVVPIALGAAGGLVASLLTGISESIAETVMATVLGVLTVAWQGIVVTVVTLNQRYPDGARSSADRPETLSLSDLATRRTQTPAPGERRPRRAATLTVFLVAAPGILYGGYLHLNPQSLPDIASRSVTESRELPESISTPFIWEKGDADELVLLGGDRAAVLAKARRARPSIQVCADRECRQRSAFEHPAFWDGSSAAAPLPDGSMAVTWVDPADLRGPSVAQIRLDRCRDQGCSRNPEEHRVIAKSDEYVSLIAIAASGTAIIVAFLSQHDRKRAELRIVRCADIFCTSPRTLAKTRVEPSKNINGIGMDEPLGLAIGAGGRPVVAYENDADGAITLFSCYDAHCRRHVTRRVVEPGFGGSAQIPGTKGVEMAVPADDRPVLLHRRIHDGAVRLLRCRTSDCVAIDAVEVAKPEVHPSSHHSDALWPPKALALDSNGLPLVVTYDFDHRSTVLVGCDTADCSRRHIKPLGETEYFYPPARLDMVVSPDGRPRILRSGIRHGERTDSQLLICRNVRCGA